MLSAPSLTNNTHAVTSWRFYVGDSAVRNRKTWKRTVKHQPLGSYEFCHFADEVGDEKLISSGPGFRGKHLFRPCKMRLINTNDSADLEKSYSDLSGVRVEQSVGGIIMGVRFPHVDMNLAVCQFSFRV